MRILKDLHLFSDKVVAYRKQLLLNNQKEIATVDPDEKKRLSFMDLILHETESRHTLNDADLKALVDTFLLAVCADAIFIELKGLILSY